MVLRLFLIALVLAGCSAAPAVPPPTTTSPVPAPIVRDDLQSAFQRAGTRGTFALYDVQTGQFTYVDRARAEDQRIPASTFKIVNTLIALETGAVKSVDEVLPYGGKPQPFPTWEKDMPMREAIKLSNVAIYQEVARRVGPERMNEWVGRLGYGNARIGQVIDRFWLDGPLQISPHEQARFLARLVQRELPIGHVDELREIVRQEPGLYGKSGWVFQEKLGWWVGWVEKDGRLWTFALQMDLPTDDLAALRLPIAKELLTTLGVL